MRLLLDTPLDATLIALGNYNTNGLLTQTAADTFTGRTITGTAAQINVANGDGVSGNPTLSLIGPYTPATYTTNGVLYGAGAGSILATTQGPANSVLTANAGAPSFSATPSVTTVNYVGTSTGQITSPSYTFSGDVLALGTAAQPDKLLIQLNANTVYKISYAASAFYGLARANGSFGSGSAVSSGNVLGTLFFAGHDGSDFTATRGYIRAVAGETWSAGVNGCYLALGSTPSGSATVAERWRVGMNGGLANTGAEPTTTGMKLKAGSATANTAPIELTSGAPETTPRAGLVEFQTDLYYATITTGPTRRTLVASQTGRATAQTAAVTSVATFTLGAADASCEVSANVLVTTSTTHNFTVTCAYTDEGNTARTLTLSFSSLAGVIATTIINTGGAVPYEGIPMHIRCKASTAITIATTGTFTTVTYNVEGVIKQVA